jgi:iron complex outermembrane receptor protein
VLEAGLRLNRTEESRAVATLDFASGARQAGRDAHVDTRLTGSLGGNWTFWQQGSDRLAWFGNYRNSFKPSAVDFGLDSEAGILKPETARSWDLGLKGSLLDGALALELSGFRMDFENLVLSQAVAGLPVLINAGQERFQGLEASAVLALAPALTGRLSYSYHDARFRDFVTDFDGVATQLAGRRLEMSPYHLGALGLSYAPSAGLTASGELGYTGDRFMDKRNRALTGGYTTLGATLGWRSRNWDVLIKGSNLTDQRQPVAESELGDAQYYLLPGRRLVASLHLRF